MKLIIIVLFAFCCTSVYGNTLSLVPDTTATDTSGLYASAQITNPCEVPVTCETCKSIINGALIPWGPVEVYNVPYNLCQGAIPSDTCKAKVLVRKRICNGKPQMKILAAKLIGGCKCPCITDPVYNLPPTMVMWLLHAVAWIGDNNPYNWSPITAPEWLEADMFSYSCNGFYKDNITCREYIIPCKEYACCVYSLKVKKDCSMNVLSMDWYDRNVKPNSGCIECSHSTNGKPRIPNDTSGRTEDSLINVLLQTPDNFFNRNIDSADNRCKWTCPTYINEQIDDNYEWGYEWYVRKDANTRTKRRKGIRRR